MSNQETYEKICAVCGKKFYTTSKSKTVCTKVCKQRLMNKSLKYQKLYQRPVKKERIIEDVKICESCKTCDYRKILSGTIKSMSRESSYCDYLSMTGELRECDPRECKKLGRWKKRTENKGVKLAWLN